MAAMEPKYDPDDGRILALICRVIGVGFSLAAIAFATVTIAGVWSWATTGDPTPTSPPESLASILVCLMMMVVATLSLCLSSWTFFYLGSPMHRE